MQTILPDLPFTNYGDAVLDGSGIHSAAESSSRTYPRTDLRTLTPWTSFPNDIHQPSYPSLQTLMHIYLPPLLTSVVGQLPPLLITRKHPRSRNSRITCTG